MVFTVSVELTVPVGIATLPAAADPQTAGDADEEQVVAGKSAAVAVHGEVVGQAAIASSAPPFTLSCGPTFDGHPSCIESFPAMGAQVVEPTSDDRTRGGVPPPPPPLVEFLADCGDA